MDQLLLPLPIPHYIVIRSEFYACPDTGIDCEVKAEVVELLGCKEEAKNLAHSLTNEQGSSYIEFTIETLYITQGEGTDTIEMADVARIFSFARAS